MAGPGGAPAVRSAELLAALSLATDLGTGQPLDHGLRTCVLSVRLAELVGADEETAAEAHTLALLHSIGCTADAHEAAILYGDDISTRADFARIDPSRSREVVGFLVRRAGAGALPPVRAGHIVEALTAGRERVGASLAAQCELADRLGGRLGLGAGARRGLRFVFERWDGRGFPTGAEAEAIPPAARLLHVARDADVFFAIGGVPAVAKMLAKRSGAAYEAALAGRFAAHAGELFAELEAGSAWEAALDVEPGERRMLGAGELDEACGVGGDFADLKSPYTLGHAPATSRLAEAGGRRLGLDDGEVADVRRAALLADVGRVGVSSALWDKPGDLTAPEWKRVRLHPQFTEWALTRSAGLAELGRVAATHQERLDGSGYHRGLPASAQPMTARLVAAADALQAMLEPRPHRPALAPEKAAEELRLEVRERRIDGDAADAVLAAADQRPPRGEWPAGLGAGEVEVLRRVVRGLTRQAIGDELGLSPASVDDHIDRAYAGLGVSSRGVAALFMVEHDLLP